MQKRLIGLIPGIFLLLAIFGFLGCSKSSSLPAAASGLTIVNAIPGSNPLLTSFLGSNGTKTTDSFPFYNFEYQNTGGISYGAYEELGSYTGTTHLSLVQISDTFQSVCNVSLNLQSGGIYYFYVTGSDTAHVDTLFTKESPPFYLSTNDSLTGVRFVNLVTGSNAISIDIQGSPNIPVISSLAYKRETGFQSFSANSAAQTDGYVFEFRDAASGSILASYTLNIVLYNSQTLALYGQPSSGLSVMAINNY